ncbi:MAG: DUF411 domain-containing protein [Thermodesulfobacteriota bacterium]
MNANQSWKRIVLITVIFSFIIGTVSVFSKSPSETSVTVYKDPSCGCCNKWVDILKEHGFQVAAHDVSDMTKIKTEYGVPVALSACHTAIVDGYVVEGHVPVDVIEKMLKEKPKVTGITVPGMPVGSPGMEGPHSEPYDVLTFDSKGNSTVYTSH